MSTLREAAKEALRWMEHARLHLTIKERMHPDGLSLYDSAAEALRAALAEPVAEVFGWVRASDAKVFSDSGTTETATLFSAEPGNVDCVALYIGAPVMCEAEPVAWQRRYLMRTGWSDWQYCVTADVEYYRSSVGSLREVRPLYAHPPRDEWRLASEPPEDLRRRVIAWRSPPQRQSGTWVEALYDDGAWVTRDGIAHDITHWRDVTPPMEGAK